MDFTDIEYSDIKHIIVCMNKCNFGAEQRTAIFDSFHTLALNVTTGPVFTSKCDASLFLSEIFCLSQTKLKASSGSVPVFLLMRSKEVPH